MGLRRAEGGRVEKQTMMRCDLRRGEEGGTEGDGGDGRRGYLSKKNAV